MNLTELPQRPDLSADDKAHKLYIQFGALLKELQKKKLSENSISLINDCVAQINSSTLTGKEFIKLLKQKQALLLKQVEKEHKIVPKNYYRNLWMLLGLSVFGIPLGVAFGMSVGNMGLLGIGFPIGMAIGLAIGTAMDKKALSQGLQLDLEIKY